MIIEFPWTERWLNGGEYEHMIRHCDEYVSQAGIKMYSEHPLVIYKTPSHGLIYFLKDESLKELGFPRVKGLKKRYKWKKMNFVTALPKQRPKVTYLVATGKLGHACYRMHIVHLEHSYPILCHMLRIQNHYKIGVGIPSRQHFKEPVLLDSSIENEPVEVKAEIAEKFEKERHPLEIDALLYMAAPFRQSLSEINVNKM